MKTLSDIDIGPFSIRFERTEKNYGLIKFVFMQRTTTNRSDVIYNAEATISDGEFLEFIDDMQEIKKSIMES